MQSGLDQGRTQWPSWVRISLWGVNTRRFVLTYIWFMLALAGFWWVLNILLTFHAISLAVSVGHLDFAAITIVGIFLIGFSSCLPALWYWAVLRWVDKHDAW